MPNAAPLPDFDTVSAPATFLPSTSPPTLCLPLPFPIHGGEGEAVEANKRAEMNIPSTNLLPEAFSSVGPMDGAALS